MSMDVNAETARKLREMGAAELLAALSAQMHRGIRTLRKFPSL